MVIKSSAVSEADAPRIPNSTGQITVAGLVSLAKLISKKISPIPSTTYRLFQSVIEARTNFHAIFQQAASENPDPELLRQNDSHKHFIDALIEAFKPPRGMSRRSDGSPEMRDLTTKKTLSR